MVYKLSQLLVWAFLLLYQIHICAAIQTGEFFLPDRNRPG
ncbi:hypothetical protein BSI_26790 [Bacillus inaquosorum KCTC 13429]|uniref:Uncharacterized protein n=1 Tax=Bacillus inaquosorum KCTC 13429 TaxID=1236548 RepID=A0A9W5PCX6_9BACI|nr:hypothetical protein BSI_26790 [Bacillus inaquosorum KCTC 13429]